MHPNCIEDHLAIAEEGFFIAGSRTLFNKKLTDLVIKTKRINFGIYTKGSSNVLNGLRIKFLREYLKKAESNAKAGVRKRDAVSRLEQLQKRS